MLRDNIENIVFVAPGAENQGGITTVVNNYRLSRFWKEQNCYLHGSCTDSGTFLFRVAHSIWRIISFFKTLIFLRPQFVGIHSSSGGSFYRKLVYILICRIFGKKVVWHIHPSHFKQFYMNGSTIRRILIRTAGKSCKKIVFLTKEMKDYFSAVWPQKDTYVLPNPVNISAFSITRKAPFNENFYILFLGWIIPEKGVYDLLDVIPEILVDFPRATFLFAGNKETDKLGKLISTRGLSDNAKVLGWVSGTEKLNLLKSSRILVLPSYSEGIPNVILEAMASGLPAITTPVGGIPSVFEEGINGFFVSPGNKKELAQRISMLLNDDGLCDRISQSTYKKASACFDVDVIGALLTQIYK